MKTVNRIDRGFTLIELVIVIIILAVVSSSIFGFINTGTQIFVDTTERDQILSESRFLVERLNRDIRYALPNSIRITEHPDTSPQYHCMEFTPIEWSAFYDDVATGVETASDNLRAPEMVGSVITSQSYDRTQADDHWVVIYPTEPQQVYATPNLDGGRRVGLFSVSAAVDSEVTVTFDDLMRFETDSTVRRFYIVSDPISYCMDAVNDRITRHTGYGFLPNQTAEVGGASLGTGILMAENVINSLSDDPNAAGNIGDPFRYSDANLERNAIVHLLLRFSRNDEVVVFNNEVHLRNVP